MIDKPNIINVRALIQEKALTIPEYQRPYKWSIKNINQLIDDVLLHRDKSAYRIGTVVLHQESTGDSESNKLNIVDGQQRCITLLLIAMALQNHLPDEVKEEMKKHHFELPNTQLFQSLNFGNPISQNNIHQNYREIRRRIIEFDFSSVRFFFDKCEVVKVTLDDISEAFQFFDSQNARGKDLEPHDLLKAFHLRELTDSISEHEKAVLIEQWEQLAGKDDKLKGLFSELLFRVRNWAKGDSARFFTKSDVDIFKGISPESEAPFPYAEMYKISHFFVEDYNSNYHRKIDKQKVEYPFQLNQVIINGKRFFEFVNHYWNIKEEMYKCLKEDYKAKEIIEVLDKYNQRNRKGDKYIRNLFDCALLFYWDKFGSKEIGRVAEKLFIWAYKRRLVQHSVQLASIDNYALEYPNVFNVIHQALQPREVLNLPITAIADNDVVRKELTDIIALTRKLNYYE
ncbi:MAG TPA: hypothetical protein DD740_05320 [Chryseobacterium sp.]|nr:hypothetical protein [Chryseobacterium sp.]